MKAHWKVSSRDRSRSTKASWIRSFPTSIISWRKKGHYLALRTRPSPSNHSVNLCPVFMIQRFTRSPKLQLLMIIKIQKQESNERAGTFLQNRVRAWSWNSKMKTRSLTTIWRLWELTHSKWWKKPRKKVNNSKRTIRRTYCKTCKTFWIKDRTMSRRPLPLQTSVLSTKVLLWTLWCLKTHWARTKRFRARSSSTLAHMSRQKDQNSSSRLMRYLKMKRSRNLSSLQT